jgi:hypothetical protein
LALRALGAAFGVPVGCGGECNRWNGGTNEVIF